MSLFSGILVAANEALLEISEVVDTAGGQGAHRGLDRTRPCWARRAVGSPSGALPGPGCTRRRACGYALWEDSRPLISGGLDRSRLRDLLDTLDSQAFAGNPRLRYPLPPSTSPEEPGFHPRSYWRGPVWPVANWLLWWSLLRAGESERAKRIRRETLEELSEGGFAEYFEPYTGEALGSGEQPGPPPSPSTCSPQGGAD